MRYVFLAFPAGKFLLIRVVDDVLLLRVRRHTRVNNLEQRAATHRRYPLQRRAKIGVPGLTLQRESVTLIQNDLFFCQQQDSDRPML